MSAILKNPSIIFTSLLFAQLAFNRDKEASCGLETKGARFDLEFSLVLAHHTHATGCSREPPHQSVLGYSFSSNSGGGVVGSVCARIFIENSTHIIYIAALKKIIFSCCVYD